MVPALKKKTGLFSGFRHGAVFKLADGTYWLQVDDQVLHHHSMNPACNIHTMDDGQFLQVDGIDGMVLVHPLRQVIESHIKGKFTGWTGKSTYQLTNGQTWQQAKFLKKYVVRYMPEVLVYTTMHGTLMQVAGTTVNVRQIG